MNDVARHSRIRLKSPEIDAKAAYHGWIRAGISLGEHLKTPEMVWQAWAEGLAGKVTRFMGHPDDKAALLVLNRAGGEEWAKRYADDLAESKRLGRPLSGSPEGKAWKIVCTMATSKARQEGVVLEPVLAKVLTMTSYASRSRQITPEVLEDTAPGAGLGRAAEDLAAWTRDEAHDEEILEIMGSDLETDVISGLILWNTPMASNEERTRKLTKVLNGTSLLQLLENTRITKGAANVLIDWILDLVEKRATGKIPAFGEQVLQGNTARHSLGKLEDMGHHLSKIQAKRLLDMIASGANLQALNTGAASSVILDNEDARNLILASPTAADVWDTAIRRAKGKSWLAVANSYGKAFDETDSLWDHIATGIDAAKDEQLDNVRASDLISLVQHKGASIRLAGIKCVARVEKLRRTQVEGPAPETEPRDRAETGKPRRSRKLQ